MKTLLFTLFIFTGTVSAFAGEFLFYTNASDFHHLIQKLKRNSRVKSATELFTTSEMKLLVGTDVNPYIIKTQIEAKELSFVTQSLNKNYSFKVEANSFYQLQSDRYLDRQWGLVNNGEMLESWLTDIDLLRIQGISGEDSNAQDIAESDRKITVAVIDSGIDINHPDLKENIYFKEKECRDLKLYKSCLAEQDKKVCDEKYAQIDNDQNGYPLDCNGWNVASKVDPITGLQGNNQIQDLIGHGTHVAGIIGAVHNEIGIRGIAKNVKLLPVQVNGSNQQVDLAPGETPTDIIAKGLLYAIKSNVQVINLSLGWSLNEDSLLMRQMIELAHKNNILVVAAGGNSHHAGPTYPCSYEDVICVGAHTVNGKLSDFSNFGTSIDIVAPGSQILSTWPTSKRPRSFTEGIGYEYMSGTSQAAPFVTGALAKLLNQGLNPSAARIKLLQGTRGKAQKYIRNGNLDVKKAIETETNSFLYPLNKTPLLVQWTPGEARKFKLKVKNYGNAVKNAILIISPDNQATQDSIELIDSHFLITKWDADEVKEFTVNFTSDDDIESDIYFDLKITSADENKTYKLHSQALTIITPQLKGENIETFTIEQNDFLSQATLRPIEGFDDKDLQDFLAIKEVNGKTQIGLLKATEKNYEFLGPLTLPLNSPIFLKFSRVNIDLTSDSEYVLTLVDMEGQGTRSSKFFVLDNNFKPYRYEVLPKNTFDNELSVLPGSYIWLRYQNKMVPAWVGLGKRPESQRESATPWEDAPVEFPKYHLYMLTTSGVKTVKLSSNEEQVAAFLYQSKEEKAQGKVQLITSDGLGYFKSYRHYEFNEKLIPLQNISLKRYHDLLGQRPLPVSSQLELASAFFFTPSVEGAQNVSIFLTTENGMSSDQFKVPSFSKYDPIVHVLKADQDGAIYQTKNHLGFYDRATHKTSKIESKVDAKRIRHQLLKYSNALFLSSAYTPGIASEVIAAKSTSNGKNIYRSSMWRMLGVKGCSEIGFIQEDNKDKLTYFCEQENIILKVNY